MDTVWIRTHDEAVIRAKSIITLQTGETACMPNA
jgi:hypothetical protein